MKYLIKKDKKRRFLFSQIEMERLRVKSIIYNRRLSLGIRLYYALKFSKMDRNTSKIRIKNRCLLTGRSQAVYRMFRLNRISLKEYFNKGQIMGLRKGSW